MGNFKEKQIMKYTLLTLVFIVFSSTLFAKSDFKVKGNDVIIDLEGYGVKSKYLKVEMWTESIVRIVSTMNDEFASQEYSLIDRPTEEVKFKTAYAQNDIEIITDKLYLSIAENGLVRLMDRKGRRMLVESDRSFEASQSENLYTVSQSIFMPRNEHVYGMIQQPEMITYNLRGKKFELIQDKNSVASHIYFSDKGYALIWDIYSKTTFEDTPAGLTLQSESTPEISYFFISGEDWYHIMDEIRKISGTAYLLPKWAYTHFVFPAAYKSDSEVENTINTLNNTGLKTDNSFPDVSFIKSEYDLYNEANQYNKNSYAYRQLQKNYETIDHAAKTRKIIPTYINLPGIQKHSTYSIAAQTPCTWAGLEGQVSAGISASLTGQAHWSVIPGGSINISEKTSNNYHELMVRWYQFAAFAPVFQSASIDSDWMLDSSNIYTKAIAQAIDFRYMLLPYIYSAAAKSYYQNTNIVRSLMFDFTNDKDVADVKNQYMFGPSLMISPIVKPNQQKHEIYLPKESNWFNYHTGESYSGGQKIQIKPELNTTPVFAKAGSAIPLFIENNEDKSKLNTIVLRVFGGSDFEYQLYNDQGDGMQYLDGQKAIIPIEYSEKKKMLTINSIDGSFTGMNEEMKIKIIYTPYIAKEDKPDDDKITEIVEQFVYSGKRVRYKF